MSDRPGTTLSRLCSGAESLVIVAPYIKADALDKVLAAASPAVSLTCITRWNPQDIAVGASDTMCRTIVTERGGSFKLHPSLHAKYYRIDDAVLIGSATLTSSAMGWSRQSNLEILCRPSDDFDALAFEQELLEQAREIGDEEFTRWEAITQIKAQGHLTIIPDGQSLRDAWRPATRDPRHLELAYRGRECEIASFDEQRAARRDIEALLIPRGMTDEQVRSWASACLLAAPFTNAVIGLQNIEVLSASRALADTYGLGVTEARRDTETVRSWLALLTSETPGKAP